MVFIRAIVCMSIVPQMLVVVSGLGRIAMPTV